MKTLLKFTVILAVVAFFATAAFSQTTRIKFKKGATSATVTGTMKSYKSTRTYIIRVREGQTLNTENVGSHSITLGIEGPPGSGYEQDMAADCHSTNEITPTAAGDYTITVTECQKADAWKGTFKMKITVN